MRKNTGNQKTKNFKSIKNLFSFYQFFGNVLYNR